MRLDRERFKELDWLLVLLVSWVMPFALVNLRPGRGYFRSLVFWLVPILFLCWHYFSIAQPDPQLALGYSRRRRALRGAILYISGLGVILDFLLGSLVLRFDKEHAAAQYILMVQGIGIKIPIEELLFYVLAPATIVLVYAWADEYWLALYSPQARREAIAPQARLISPSPTTIAFGVVLLCLGMVYKAAWGPGPGIIPAYFSFLVVAAIVPAALLFRAVRDYVNWRAFAVTTLYVICTSLLWETTLAIPRKWWGYREDTILGPVIPDWSRDGWIFPIEAALVWICAPFSCVLTYEYIKAARYRASAAELSRRL